MFIWDEFPSYFRGRWRTLYALTGELPPELEIYVKATVICTTTLQTEATVPLFDRYEVPAVERMTAPEYRQARTSRSR